MKHAIRTKTFGLCWAVLLAASCGSPSSGDSNDPNLTNDIGAIRAGLHKGTAGAMNGDANYCDDPSNLCAAGEGDCDKTAQCEAGLVCGRSKLIQFGFPGGDACVPAHCTNKVKDDDETQIDCGGSCGTTCPPVVCPANGAANRCSSDCLCAAGEGDCDSSAECEAGLVCGGSKLIQFGFPAGDACVPAHCTNKVKDGDETQIDCGGSCGTTCPPLCAAEGAAGRCNSDCLCGDGEGECTKSDQCQAGLVCGGKLTQFGFPAGNACVPSHCTNKVKDGDETQIDCGGSCGTTCPPLCAPEGAAGRCNSDCLCGAGEGGCTTSDECISPLVCGKGKLTQFGFPSGNACIAAHCTNNTRDADETAVDCGGECGSIGCSTRGCDQDATYEITVTDKFHEQFNGSPDTSGCTEWDRYKYQHVLEAKVSQGSVTVTGEGFSGTYSVVEDTTNVFEATATSGICGTYAEEPNFSGQATLKISCETGVATFGAKCTADYPDTCFPNYTETVNGSGTASSSGGASGAGGADGGATGGAGGVATGGAGGVATGGAGGVATGGAGGASTGGAGGVATGGAGGVATGGAGGVATGGAGGVATGGAGGVATGGTSSSGGASGSGGASSGGDGGTACGPGDVCGGSPWAAVSAGRDHTCGLRADGTVACWGQNGYGEATPPSAKFSAISAGWYSTCGLRLDRTIACWGENQFGQSSPPSGMFSSVTTGWLYACGLRLDGTIVCWGNDSQGVTASPSGAFSAISAEASHACGLRTDGTIACWGENPSGNASTNTPPTGPFTSLNVGTLDACAIGADQTLVCWWMVSGTDTPPSGTFLSEDSGFYYDCAVRTDDTLACWTISSGTQYYSAPPAGTFESVSVGVTQACGVRTDGSIVCWGWACGTSNDFGQCTPP